MLFYKMYGVLWDKQLKKYQRKDFNFLFRKNLWIWVSFKWIFECVFDLFAQILPKFWCIKLENQKNMLFRWSKLTNTSQLNKYFNLPKNKRKKIAVQFLPGDIRHTGTDRPAVPPAFCNITVPSWSGARILPW